MRFDDVLGIHAQALQLKARRAEVLAANIANADTPGYQARDFDFRQMLDREQASAVRMQATQQGHMRPDAGLVPEAELLYRVPSQASLDGNSVDSQLEHAAYTENALEYQASLQFLNGEIKRLMSAIKGQ